MTLSPVFRSSQAVEILRREGIWDRFAPATALQRSAVDELRRDLRSVIGERWLTAEVSGSAGADDLGFLQDFFFLNLFLAVFEALGVDPARLPFYARLNFIIMGTITAADNLFDDQDKSLLPLAPVAGPRYRSILQLICFERLLTRAGMRALLEGAVDISQIEALQLALMNQMAEIGLLEGSEEGGVDEIPTPEEMIAKVHRVRGGLLFGLAFCAPEVLERGKVLERTRIAAPAIARLGTAFQIVDDLTDFEFDIERRSHNLLVAEIYHHGSPAEKERLRLLMAGTEAEAGLVEQLFAPSARRVLDRARAEARASFETLAQVGFWFPPALSDEVVRAIVGLDGVARMDALTGK